MPLASFPEELLERILAHVVIAPAEPHPRAPWHASSSSSLSGKETKGRIAPLLVSRAFHRIALPLFYDTLVLHSPRQSSALLQALRARPALAREVRVLVLSSPSKSDAEVLRMLPRLSSLDVALPASGNHDADAIGEENAGIDMLCDTIRQLRTIRTVSVRKAAGTYLSQPAPRALLDALSDAVYGCTELHTFTLAFPLSSDPSLCPLISALSRAPALRSLFTPLPALPGATASYVAVADNAALERVCLGAPSTMESRLMPYSGPFEPADLGACASAPIYGVAGGPYGDKELRAPECRAAFSSHPRASRPVLSTSLFLAAARPHPRLSELIRAGTNITVGWRGRAATVGGC